MDKSYIDWMLLYWDTTTRALFPLTLAQKHMYFWLTLASVSLSWTRPRAAGQGYPQSALSSASVWSLIPPVGWALCWVKPEWVCGQPDDKSWHCQHTLDTPQTLSLQGTINPWRARSVGLCTCNVSGQTLVWPVLICPAGLLKGGL